MLNIVKKFLETCDKLHINKKAALKTIIKKAAPINIPLKWIIGSSILGGTVLGAGGTYWATRDSRDWEQEVLKQQKKYQELSNANVTVPLASLTGGLVGYTVGPQLFKDTDPMIAKLTGGAIGAGLGGTLAHIGLNYL